MSTKIQAFCTLRRPFDIVFNALLIHAYDPIQPLQNVRIMNMVITRVKKRSPDMILTAFDKTFHEKKDEIPPGACRPAYTSNPPTSSERRAC